VDERYDSGKQGNSKYIFDSYGVALRGTTVKILDRVDFDLRRGEVHILVGENGAGKSTLMKVLGGIIPPDEGRMLLDGAAIAPKNPREAQELGVGIIHQELNLCENLTVADNIYMGREIKKGALRDARAMRAGARALLGGMGIDIDPDAPVRKLSTAQQQLVEIVKVLSKNCRIIIMDEPTSSADPQRDRHPVPADQKAALGRRGAHLHLPSAGGVQRDRRPAERAPGRPVHRHPRARGIPDRPDCANDGGPAAGRPVRQPPHTREGRGAGRPKPAP
jgi:ABC-type lipoprotein export system ATPase subunit